MASPYEKYFVSNDGKIFSLKKEDIYELKTFIRSGYKSVGLYSSSDGRRKNFQLHRIILETFNGRSKIDKSLVRHLNDNPFDNRIENLAWGSVQDNSDDMIKNGRSTAGEKHPKAKLDNETVLHIRKELENGISGNFLAKKYNISKSVISMIKNRKIWRHI